MEIEEILKELEYGRGYFPYEAVQEAIRRKDEIIPELIKILEYTEKNIHKIENDPDYVAHMFAMSLLAQFREKRAYPLVVKIFSYPGETPWRIVGDFVIDYLPRVLASLSSGDTTLIKQLIENRKVDEYVRAGALEALLILVINGQMSREELIDYFKSLIREKLERKPSLIWVDLALFSSYLCAEELYEDIKLAYQEGLIEPLFFRMEDFDEYIAKGWEKSLEELKSERDYRFIEDTVECMRGYGCFEPERETDFNTLYLPEPQLERRKIGRNEPCPCGSGKKYKKCCGLLED
jgi:hypothetical protein